MRLRKMYDLITICYCHPLKLFSYRNVSKNTVKIKSVETKTFLLSHIGFIILKYTPEQQERGKELFECLVL